MKGTPLTVTEPDWKQFLRLVEQLLNEPTSSRQCRLIKEKLQTKLKCQATIWLIKPFYPLPNETDHHILNPENTSGLIQHVLDTRQVSCVVNDMVSTFSDAQPELPHIVAIPLITQNNLLGVIQIEKKNRSKITFDDVSYVDHFSAYVALGLETSRQVFLKNWRYEQLSLVRSVSNQIANYTNLNELCRRVTQLIRETFNYYDVAIFTTETKGETLTFRANSSVKDISEVFKNIGLKYGEGIVGHVALAGQELFVPDIRKDPRYYYLKELPDTLSEFAVPLRIENQTLGVLDVQSDQVNGFHEIDMLVLRSLADNIALAVEGAELYSGLQRRADQIASIVEITSVINSKLDLDELLEEVVKLIQKRFGYLFVHIFTVHSGRRKVIFQMGSSALNKTLSGIDVIYDLDDPIGIIPWVARSRKTLLANDVNMEPLYRATNIPPANTQAELAVPLIYAGEIMGVLDIQSDQVNAFDNLDLSLFETLAASIAIALRNANLFRSDRWRLQVAESFYEVVRLLATNAPQQNIFDTILQRLHQILPCDAAVFWLVGDAGVNEKSDDVNFKLAACIGSDPGLIVNTINNTPSIRLVMREFLYSSEPHIRKPSEPMEPLGLSLGFDPNYSAITAALRIGDNPVGFLILVHHTGGRYGNVACDLTTTFASYASIAIQNAHLFSEVQEQAWVSTVLLQVAEACQSSNTIDELLSTMTRLTPLLVGIKQCAIFLRDETRQTFVLNSSYGIKPVYEKLEFDESNTPAFDKLLNNKSTMLIQDPDTELNLPNTFSVSDDHSMVILPLISRGKILGAYLISHQTNTVQSTGQLSEDQTLAILQGIAHQTAVALENMQLMEARQEEAYVTAVLLQVAQAVVSQNDLADILETIVNLMPILVGIDACIIYLWDDKNKMFQPATAYTKSRDFEAYLKNSSYLPEEYRLLDQVHKSLTPCIALIDPLASMPQDWPCLESQLFENLSQFNLRTDGSLLMGFPLSVKGEFYGVFLTKEVGLQLDVQERRLEIVTGIAQQVTLAIQNERVEIEKSEQQRIEREFQLARQIQKTFLPEFLPHIKGWEFTALWQTARNVGGDWYDLIRIDATHVGLVIADVSDKGLAAALYMTVTRTLIRANVQQYSSPAAVLELVNGLLLTDQKNGMFVTAVFCILNIKSGYLMYANAGHNRPFKWCADSGIAEQLPKGGIALGVLPDVQYIDHHIKLNDDDFLVLYTDGVTDTLSPTGETFGEERFLQTIKNYIGQPAGEFLKILDSELKSFREDTSAFDDVTLLVAHKLKKITGNHSPKKSSRQIAQGSTET